MPEKKIKSKAKREHIKKLKIKTYIIPIASFIIILIAVLILKFAVFNDKIVAYVNNKPIYLSEINLRYTLYQGIYTKEEFLNQTVVEELLLQEARKQGLSISDEEFNSMIESFLQSSGTTKKELDKQLKELGSSYKEFEKSSRERVVINMLLESILANITVTEKEIKDYYNLVKDELPEDITYNDVKELINQSLSNQKSDAIFQEYVEELRAKAEIVVFDEYIKEKQEDMEKRIDLAKCLTENKVKMYGSTTCSACITQKRMFGDAVEFLDIVECDLEEGKQECQDMAIKATPTWIVNNIKYTEVLSLEGLADLAGCEY